MDMQAASRFSPQPTMLSWHSGLKKKTNSSGKQSPSLLQGVAKAAIANLLGLSLTNCGSDRRGHHLWMSCRGSSRSWDFLIDVLDYVDEIGLGCFGCLDTLHHGDEKLLGCSVLTWLSNEFTWLSCNESWDCQRLTWLSNESWDCERLVFNLDAIRRPALTSWASFFGHWWASWGHGWYYMGLQAVFDWSQPAIDI